MTKARIHLAMLVGGYYGWWCYLEGCRGFQVLRKMKLRELRVAILCQGTIIRLERRKARHLQ